AKSALMEPAQQQGNFISPNFTYSTEAVEAILAYLTQQHSKEIEAAQLQATCQKIEQFLMEKASILPLTEVANPLQIEVQEVEKIVCAPQISEQAVADNEPLEEAVVEAQVENAVHEEVAVKAQAENVILEGDEVQGENVAFEEGAVETPVEAEKIQEVAPEIAMKIEEAVKEKTQVQAEVIAQKNTNAPRKPAQNSQLIKWIMIGIAIVALLIFASWYFR
ncbi:MAG: hypothetical protein ACKVTZ_18505, partial [Bacteroidia bacterium]